MKRHHTPLALAALLGFGLSTPLLAQDHGSMDHAHEMDSSQPGTDTWITTKVKADLATTDGVKSTEISVNTTNGVVTLIGVLGSETAVKKAVAVAKGIKGVVEVDASGLKAK